MSYYDKHLFFCVNQRETDRSSCGDKNAQALYDYAKKCIKRLDVAEVGKIRVSQSGCMGRCKQGPVLVIYPEAVWYTYASEADIDEIIAQHLVKKELVDRLFLPDSR